MSLAARLRNAEPSYCSKYSAALGIDAVPRSRPNALSREQGRCENYERVHWDHPLCADVLEAQFPGEPANRYRRHRARACCHLRLNRKAWSDSVVPLANAEARVSDVDGALARVGESSQTDTMYVDCHLSALDYPPPVRNLSELVRRRMDSPQRRRGLGITLPDWLAVCRYGAVQQLPGQGPDSGI